MSQHFPLKRDGGLSALARGLALAASVGFFPRPAAGNPSHPVVTTGSATFYNQGSQLTIRTGGNTLINWSSFNIGVGQTTTFIEPSASSVVWNHISDPNPTQILGHLDANGFVVLQNQSGFYIGGNAVINAAGLVMTTTPTVPPNVFSGGAWEFTAPPPTASIINYGEINAGQGGSVFLISHDIENNGTITAPRGNIGLCAGQNVLMSSRADGRGFSAEVTLPEGSVDNSGKLIADAGTIALNAQVVNQGGMIQANSVRNDNGVIEIVASDNITLGANSTISAKGDSQGVSRGGQVTIKSGGTFSDAPGSLVDVSGGAQGGAGGQLEISAPQLSSIQSQVIGHANPGWAGGLLSIDPQNITLISSGSTASSGTVTESSPPTTGTLTLNPSSLDSFSQILLQASGNITLSSSWTVPDAASATTLTLQAGGNITFGSTTTSDNLSVGKNWTIDLIAGATFSTPTSVKSGTGTITLDGTSGIQSEDGAINLIAGSGITVGAGQIVSTAGGSILMQSIGGSITMSGSTWTLPNSPVPANLTLQANNDINFASPSSSSVGLNLTVGQNWSVDLIAGATFNPATVVAASSLSTHNEIFFGPPAGIHSANGDITLIAGNGISLGANGTIDSSQGGSIVLQSVSPSQSISLGTIPWTLPDSTTPASVDIEAGGNVTFGSGGITAGDNWTIDVIAGALFNFAQSPAGVTVNTKDTGSITLGAAVLQTENGNINLSAGNGISATTGGINTQGGGSIDVDAVGGSVNTGANVNGYAFRTGGVSSLLGGFSTADGGNVNITAGGNVTSYLPTGSSATPTDAGTGAFGPEPGNVTITAGGSVYGNYVVADGAGTITAETGSAGSTASASEQLALSLAAGSWAVNAPDGSINLQEVRNPQGAMDAVGIGAESVNNNVFNYSATASVTLTARAVNLLGGSLAPVPRESGYLVPILYPPILTINAGAGGVLLGDNVTLFPSPQGELTVNTTVPAGTAANGPGLPPPGSFVGNGFTLAMSDSSANRWIQQGQPGATDFATDHGSVPIQLNSAQPVVFDIAGDLDNATLIMPKATQVTVGGNMNNLNFIGQNLHNSDVTSFNVTGNIIDQNTYAFETVSGGLTLPSALYTGAQRNYLELLQNAVVPGSGPGSVDDGALFPSLELFYIPSTKQLGYLGIMTPAIESELLGTLQEKTFYPNGQPVVNAQGLYVTTPVTFAANSGATQPIYQAIQALYTASQSSVLPANAPQGIEIGGPGQLNITAQAMNLGASALGITSVGPSVNTALAKIATTGAAIHINLTGDLDMFASQISSLFGGAIDIEAGGSIDAGLPNLPLQNPYAPHGIWTSAKSDISVIATGDIDVDGSRIAAFDGGNVFVESLTGNVDAGDGGLNEVLVNEVRVNPTTGAVTTPTQAIAGSGILATTLPDAPRGLEVGNITVETPEGDIDAGEGGITQEPENGNSSLTPTVTLTAGTVDAATGAVIHPGDINAGNSGIIAINVDAQAAGKINGLFISSGNADIHADTIDVTALAGGTASLSASGTITGLAIAGGGINISGGKFEGVALSQNVSGGGAQSALASSASAAAGSQTSAAAEASSQKSETSDQPTTASDDDQKRHRGRALLAKYTGRVQVLLPAKR